MPASLGTAACGGVCGSSSGASRPRARHEMPTRNSRSTRSPRRPMCPGRSWRRCWTVPNRPLVGCWATGAQRRAYNLMPFEPRVAAWACAARPRGHRGPALRARQIASAVGVAEGTFETLLERADTRAVRPHWACRGYTRDIRALGHHHASEFSEGPRVAACAARPRGIEAAGRQRLSCRFAPCS
jgi:hypothetical protein